MTERPDPALTPYGLLIEDARKRLKISKREAARRAGISEGWWRQIVTGVQKLGGIEVPTNPKDSTLVDMAVAVEADADEVLQAAGRKPRPRAEGAGLDHLREEVAASNLSSEAKRYILDELPTPEPQEKPRDLEGPIALS